MSTNAYNLTGTELKQDEKDREGAMMSHWDGFSKEDTELWTRIISNANAATIANAVAAAAHGTKQPAA